MVVCGDLGSQLGNQVTRPEVEVEAYNHLEPIKIGEGNISCFLRLEPVLGGKTLMDTSESIPDLYPL